MATHHGSEGSVTIGGNPVAELRSVSLTETAETVDSSAMGDTARTHMLSLTSASGSMTCWWDGTDTNGQEAMTIGASVDIETLLEGAGSGARYADFTATITGVSVSAAMDGITERNFDFTVNGAVTWSNKV